MRFHRIVAVAAAAISLTVSTAACAKVVGQTEGSNQLTYWTGVDATGAAPLQQELAAFTAKTGIKVKLTIYSTDALKQALSNAAGTSALPDVFSNWTGQGLSGFLVNTGSVQPLDAYYKKYSWTSRFSPGSLKLVTFNGKKLAVPNDVNGMAIVYRKDIFAKAGITTPPTTYAELLADNNKLKSAGFVPMSLAGKYSWDTMRLLDDLMETKCGAATFDQLRDLKLSWTRTACATAGFTELQSWVKRGYLTSDYMGLDPDSNQMYNAIFQGKAAMTVDGQWSVGTLQQAKQNLSNYGFFLFPTGTGRLSYFAGGLWISSKSKHKDEAAELLNYLTSKSVDEKLQVLPAANTAVAPPPGSPPQTVSWVSFIAKFPNIYLPSDQALPPDVAQSYLRNQDAVVLGQETPAQAVAALQRDINTYKSAHPNG